MHWDAILLFLVGVYATIKTSRWAYQLNNLKYLCFALAALSFSIGQGSIVISSLLSSTGITYDNALVVELSTVVGISFVLCALAVLIRESKPVFAQFPLIYAGVPLLLIISYWLVKDSFAIKEWLISIYQGGALLVALMMYGAHTYRDANRFTPLIATIMLILTFILYWFIPGMQSTYSWMWQLGLGIGFILLTKGFELSINIDAEEAALD